jgi:hypothetical protein
VRPHHCFSPTWSPPSRQPPPAIIQRHLRVPDLRLGRTMLIALTTGTLMSSTSPAFLCHDQLLIDRSPPAKSTPFAGAPPRGTLPTCPSSLTSAPPRSTRATADSLVGEPSTFPTPPIQFLPLRCRSSPPSPLAPGFRLAGISRCH